MEQMTRQCVGIDIAKKDFTACVCKSSPHSGSCFSQAATFENSARGFTSCSSGLSRQTTPALPVSFAMEATGIYHEPLAYHLHRLEQAVSVVLPNKVRHFGKSLNVKSKTDRIDARVIAQLGAERQLPAWQPSAPVFKALRELTGHCTDLKQERTVLLNRLSALLSAHETQAFVIRSHREVIQKFDTGIARCEARIKAVLQKEEWLQEKVDRLLSIKGVGLRCRIGKLSEHSSMSLKGSMDKLFSYWCTSSRTPRRTTRPSPSR